MRRLFASLSSLGLLGCSLVDDFERFRPAARDGAADDTGVSDASEPDSTLSANDAGGPRDADVDARVDGGAQPSEAGVDCTEAPDHARCGDGRICRFKLCQASVCGDGFVDEARGERCDDGNAQRGDGCEPGSCSYSCDEDAQCDDERPCNGRERCDRAQHRCLPGVASSGQGQPCTTANSADGTCASGLCVPRSCGNGVVDSGEACEPSLAQCRADCQFGCRSDAECDNRDACDGVEVCDLTLRDCRPGTPPECVDADECTVNNVCDPSSGCMFRLIDQDGDMYSPPPCAASSGREPDCNDANAAVWPSARERCDGVDNDCDGQIDEGVLVACFADQDGDGYPNRMDMRVACTCPERTVAVPDPLTYTRWDCWDDPLDRGAEVFPGQTEYREDGYGPGGRRNGSFDYDCDGSETPLYGAIAPNACVGLLGLVCDMSQGFSRTAAACGESATYLTCSLGALACQARESTRTQACR